MEKITEPRPITKEHSFANFDCGTDSLNDWLRRHALKNQASGASRTFVACSNNDIVGYYALAAGSIARQQDQGKIKREMPNLIPVMILGRLAVDRQWQLSGIGKGLLKDALLRTLTVSNQAGIRALLLHALSEDAKAFYIHHGFSKSSTDQFALMLCLKEIQKYFR